LNGPSYTEINEIVRFMFNIKGRKDMAGNNFPIDVNSSNTRRTKAEA